MEERIRKRKSYKLWKEFANVVKQPTADNLRGLFRLLDKNSFFGSYTKSFYAQESLDLYIKDTLTIH